MKHRTAIVYDYDGTLASGNIQEHSFLPAMDITKEQFWTEVKELTKKHDADQILVYMWHILEKARAKGLKITKDVLKKHGEGTRLFEGLESWFKRINDYGSERNLDIEHYIISAGTAEMIEGSPIFQEFKAVYASRFIYNSSGEAIWPGLAINFTNKTQFLFRINKGIENSWDDTSINKFMPENERPIPFSRIVFLGDGATDIPAMKMVRHQGGHSVAVFDPVEFKEDTSQKHVYGLIAEDRANFVVPADYSEGTLLDVTLKGVLGRIARGTGYRGE